ncbi:hypothetical protein RB200_05260 [Streptomyces sp. PmtG]
MEPEHRFEWWRDLIQQDVAPTRITTDRAEDFPATAGIAQLGAVRLTAMSFPAIRSERTPALIRYSDPEDYQLHVDPRHRDVDLPGPQRGQDGGR